MTGKDREIDVFFGEFERPKRWEKPKNYIGTERFFNMAIQKDCFAYRIGRCGVMTELICKRRRCSFYKSKEQEREDRERYGYDKNYKQRSEES